MSHLPPSYSPPSAPNQHSPAPHERTPLVSTSKYSSSRLNRFLLTAVAVLLAVICVQFTTYHNSLDNPAYRDRIRKEWAAEETRRYERIREEDARRQKRIGHEDAERERRFQDRTRDLDARQKWIEDKERDVKEEELRRKKANLAWVHLTAHERCLAYNTRQYHAELVNIPGNENAQSWCMQTPIVIHDVKHEKPDYCIVENAMDKGRQVFAYWTATSNEPTCMTSWTKLQDKGCAIRGSRQRIFEAQLWNHQPPWDNWREMCATTPIRFDDHTFDRPISCEVGGVEGIWGSWVVHDDNC